MFADIINKLAKEFQGQDEEKVSYFARPSLAGPERCIRALTYHAMGEPAKPYPGRAILTFDDSLWHEELTKDWFRKSIYRIHSEQMPVDIPSPGVNMVSHWCKVCEKDIRPERIHGHLDWITQDPLGKEWVVEHKAINHFGFERLKEKALPLEYLTQVALYSLGLQLIQPSLVSVLLLIKNKNTSQYLEFECEYRLTEDTLFIHKQIASFGDAPAKVTILNQEIPNIVNSSLARFRDIKNFASERYLPLRPYSPNTEYPCGYCNWAVPCWAGYVDEINALETDVALSADLETTARYYKELGAQESEIKKEREQLKEILKQALLNIGARTGKTDNYTVALSAFIRQEIDKNLVPPEAFKPVPAERFTVTKTKEKKDEKIHSN